MITNDIKNTIKLLQEKYPAPKTELHFDTPFELLIATILSAQTTDKQVNKVTCQLFKKYNRPEDFATLQEKQLQEEISSIGLHHNKSKYIIESSKMIINKYNGHLPDNRKELMQLPGVGRKTANVVLACAFNKNAIAVDTHVFRVANRLGIVNASTVNQTEKQLMTKIPENLWANMHHWLIFHGRNICKARRPECSNCMLCKYCEYKQKNID